jgi:hypothetical protein
MSNQSNQIKYRFNQYFNLPNPGLRAYFQHVESGSDEEYRTTFFRDKSLEDILQGWNRTLTKIKREWPTLYEFENDLRKKVGPMSIMRPLQDRMPDIDSYYDSISLESVPISQAAVEATINWFSPLRGLRVREQARTLDLMKKSTNSGSPYFTKRRAVVDKTYPSTVYSNTQILHSHEWGSAAILGWRGQEGGPLFDDVKQRVVWMFPFAVNLCELQMYQPLIEGCQNHNLVPAWIGMDAVDREITALFDTKSKNDLIICTDFSKFDQHFNSDMQHCARAILEGICAPNEDNHKWLEEVFPIKYDIPLAYDYGKVRYGAHGMGSGSGGTNADETLTHRALQYEAALSQSKTLNPHSMCLGDDGILSYPGINIDDVVRTYASHGQEMNTDKQYASKHDCTYLRRWHHTDYRVDGVCVGVYSTFRALGRLAEQERYYNPEVWGPKMVALRQLSIMENVKWHPLRDEFANYCMKGDKYRLGIDIPGFLDNIEAEAQKATDYMPDFLGYTKSLQYESRDRKAGTGISDWWIVQYLKSKA